MQTFTNLVNLLSSYEDKWTLSAAGAMARLPSCSNSAVQFVGVEPDITGHVDTPLPVVIAVGINYDQGLNPNRHFRWLRDANEKSDGVTDCYWNPDKASDMRHALDYALGCYHRNSSEWTKVQQNGYAHSSGNVPFPITEYILIATNLCPFITKRQWSDGTISHNARSQMRGMWPFYFDHLNDLAAILKDDVALWVGHGAGYVWDDFLRWITHSAKTPWILTYNLGRQGHGIMKNLRAKQHPLFC